MPERIGKKCALTAASIGLSLAAVMSPSDLLLQDNNGHRTNPMVERTNHGLILEELALPYQLKDIQKQLDENARIDQAFEARLLNLSPEEKQQSANLIYDTQFFFNPYLRYEEFQRYLYRHIPNPTENFATYFRFMRGKIQISEGLIYVTWPQARDYGDTDNSTSPTTAMGAAFGQFTSHFDKQEKISGVSLDGKLLFAEKNKIPNLDSFIIPPDNKYLQPYLNPSQLEQALGTVFILPENLEKKHFNPKDNWVLGDEMMNNQSSKNGLSIRGKYPDGNTLLASVYDNGFFRVEIYR